MPSPALILSIAGSDCSAGAGIQADLKSICSLRGYGLTALTSVVAEVPGKVARIQLLEPSLIQDQIRVLAESFPIAAVKTGMLGGVAQVKAVLQSWKEHFQQRVPLIVDPVMVATSGNPLLDEAAVDLMQKELLPLATLITPNMDEARVLWGKTLRNRADMERCGEELVQKYQTAVLIKGGHLQKDNAADLLLEANGNMYWVESLRVEGVSTHGTGCSYSAAIATGLGQGMSLRDAVEQAKAFISRAIEKHLSWQGKPHTIHALHHFAS
jgi:hydroxymethylpyrimidine/phosphomethylpyrimidine kinase